ncbi:hypothetical protein [Aquipseudomonas guryensis]|uniref:Mannitol repressor n=1 Tax=Aquipseudomonas guryensis TaxID=2759165 RepID=A0A7W4H495_9GAMM|nr:hypothetical protein [Pseudomonas guryensis]MBB1520376.1 hypothetical protein [Pseudomonas guryensis]
MDTMSKPDHDLAKFLAHMPWDAQDETLIILKGQLLVEDLLREFCQSRVNDPAQLVKAKLNFEQTSCLSRSLLKFPGKDWVWGSAGQLNSLRNSLAHQLEPKNIEKKRSEFVQLVFSETKPSQDLMSAFKSPHGEVAAAVFLLYMSLSAQLNFKPKGLLEYALESSGAQV